MVAAQVCAGRRFGHASDQVTQVTAKKTPAAPEYFLQSLGTVHVESFFFSTENFVALLL